MYFHELVELNRMESNRCQRSSAKASFDNIDNDFIVITTLEGAKREQSGTAVSRDRRVCFSLGKSRCEILDCAGPINAGINAELRRRFAILQIDDS